MATGETTSGSLSGALPTIVGEVRVKLEYAGTWRRTCEIQRQREGEGLNWTEYTLNKVSGQDISETTDNRNFQQLSGSLQSVEPTMSQIIIKITDKSYRKLAKIVTGRFGGLAGQAMDRKQDEDYLATFSSFATACSPGTGNPLSFGYIAAAKNRCSSNTTEPSMAEVFTVLHGFQIYDLQAELVSGIGTYTVPAGMTEQIYRQGFRGGVAGSNVFEDGNITVDSVPDANGATHTRNGVIACIGMEIKHKTDYDMYFGGGAEVMSLVNEYAFTERLSGSTQVWAWLHKSDATAPTS